MGTEGIQTTTVKKEKTTNGLPSGFDEWLPNFQRGLKDISIETESSGEVVKKSVISTASLSTNAHSKHNRRLADDDGRRHAKGIIYSPSIRKDFSRSEDDKTPAEGPLLGSPSRYGACGVCAIVARLSLPLAGSPIGIDPGFLI